MRTSGAAGSTSGRNPARARRTSTTASFSFCSTKWVWVSASARPLAATASVCPRAMSSVQGSLAAPSYSSSALVAANSPTGSSTRSAVRSSRHARSAISRSPVNRTKPRPARMPFAPMPRSSPSRASSAPRGQVEYQDWNTSSRLSQPDLPEVIGRKHAVLRRDGGERRQRQLHHRQVAKLRAEQLDVQLRIFMAQRLQSEGDLSRILQALLHQAWSRQIRIAGARLQELAQGEALRAGEESQRFPRHLQEPHRVEIASEPFELRQRLRAVDGVVISPLHGVQQAHHLAPERLAQRMLDAFHFRVLRCEGAPARRVRRGAAEAGL